MRCIAQLLLQRHIKNQLVDDLVINKVEVEFAKQERHEFSFPDNSTYNT